MKKKNHMRFVKKEAYMSYMKRSQQSEPTKESLKLYQDCRIPLDRFVDCLIDKELERLVISGNPTEFQLNEAWGKVYVEYLELTNKDSYNPMLDKMIDINTISAKVYFVDKALDFLRLNYDKEIVKILDEFGLQTNIFETDNILERMRKFNQIVGRVKLWVIQQSILQKEFDELEAVNNAQKNGRYYFDDALDAISRLRHYQVEAKAITVIQFCRALKQMEYEYNKKMMEKTS